VSREQHLTDQLKDILSEEAFALMAQELGGTRVYVPSRLSDDNEIVQAIGRASAEALSKALSGATIRMPLARHERALYWRGQGLSNSRIARKLGITEGGIDRLFARTLNRDDDSPASPRTLAAGDAGSVRA